MTNRHPKKQSTQTSAIFRTWKQGQLSGRSAASTTICLLELVFVSGQVAQLVERSPEKAGVGGSIPSLATTFSITYSHSNRQFHSISFQNNGAGRLASFENAVLEARGLALDSALFSWTHQARSARVKSLH
jgi:hypothetical protein